MAPGSRDGARMANRKVSRVATATMKMNARECLGSDHRQGANGYASLQVRLVRPSFFCTSLHPSTTCLYVCLFVCQLFIRHHFIIPPSVYPFIHPLSFTLQSHHPSITMSLSSPIYPPSIQPSILPQIHPAVYPLIYPFFIHPSLCNHPSVLPIAHLHT